MEIYAACHGIIKKDGKILLGIRNKKISKHHGKYFSIGGTLELMETLNECFVREVKEETNITVKNIKFFKVYERIDVNKKESPHILMFIYTAEYNSGELKGDDDCVDPEFFTIEEIKKLIKEDNLHPFTIEILNDLSEI